LKITNDSVLFDNQNVWKSAEEEHLSERVRVALSSAEEGSFLEPKARNKIRTFLGGLVDPV
jgi:hypothetical protein